MNLCAVVTPAGLCSRMLWRLVALIPDMLFHHFCYQRVPAAIVARSL